MHKHVLLVCGGVVLTLIGLAALMIRPKGMITTIIGIVFYSPLIGAALLPFFNTSIGQEDSQKWLRQARASRRPGANPPGL